jgi:hypothetical protein
MRSFFHRLMHDSYNKYKKTNRKMHTFIHNFFIKTNKRALLNQISEYESVEAMKQASTKKVRIFILTFLISYASLEDFCFIIAFIS